MLKQFKKYIKSQAKTQDTKDLPCIYEQINRNPKFQLKHQENIIGYLNYENSSWNFYYSDWFKNQNDLKPLFEFPLKEKNYTSKELWPFFESRIPSLKQPRIQNYLESHPMDSNDKVKLLQVFGITSINNPYKLLSL
ncbi:HipA N-terminal domain-containing protein [Christiangramia portivictoriae]|uniref:HipA N-terminal domain-containing protein n=1 Tax=Christiangramia portivictoriae TaxID=326069 RepID=UPI00047CDA1B|nr:HipA N-terminal domain-containing protein [Christiangramia portivictoriae]